MFHRSLLGCAALIASTSCVPDHAAGRHAGDTMPITYSEAALLRQLALNPPSDDGAPAPAIATDLAPLAGAPPFAGHARTAEDARRAVECLTEAVYYEARSEPLDGQRAVAQVVLNRVRDRAFPASVCGVVFQRNPRGCQFTFACDGSTAFPRERSAWERAAAVARAAFDGAVYAPVGAATHYHTAAILPWWAPSLARIGRVGAHVFYGWRGAMARALSFRSHYVGIEPGETAAPGLIASAVEGDATIVKGVAIHRGDTAEGWMSGVRVHRGTPPEAAPTKEQPSIVMATPMHMAAGVRIHRGVAGPALADAGEPDDVSGS